MVYNPSQVNFYSGDDVDIVVYENVDTPLQYTVAGGGTTSTQTVTNTYGLAAKITLAWSIDGTNYYPAQAYTDATAPYTANGWCDATDVYIYMENFSAGSVDFNIIFTLDTV